MHRTRFMFGMSALVLAAGIVVSAQQGQGGGPKSTPPKPNAATPTAAKPATPAPHPATAGAAQAKTKTPAPPAAMASGNKSQAKPTTAPATASKTATSPAATKTTAKNDKAAATKVAKADGKTAKPADTKVAKTAEKKSDKPSTKTTTAAKTTTPPPTALTPVQEKLKQNTNLAAKLQERLPKGTDLIGAAAGFRNLGQFVAAVNVANNLNISFTELKTKLVTNNMSLGQAIQAVRPLTASPTIEAQHAEYEARGMISETEQTEASAPAKTHGPVTTGTTTPTATTSSPAKAKAKTTKTSAQ